MRTFEIILLVITILLLVTIFVYLSFFLICYNFSISKNGIMKFIIKDQMKKHKDVFKMDFSWWDTKDVTHFNMKSPDNIKLQSHLVSVNNGKKFAVVVHGYQANYLEMQRYAKMFTELGYNVLCVENRAHGKSGGRTITMGYKDKYDVLHWIDFLIGKFGGDIEICVFGLSMGAATTCMLSGLNLPSNVKCLVSDCAYSSVYEQFKYVVSYSKFIGKFPIVQTFNHFCKIFCKLDFKKVSTLTELPKLKIPILFIHGDKDWFVPFENLEKNFNAAPADLRYKKVFNDCGHGECLPKYDEEYISAVKEFVEKFI